MQERKSFDEKFVRMDTKRLCELTSAADSLQLKPLVDLTSRALARVIEGKTPEEIREIFHLPDDLTEVFCRCQQCTCLMSFSFLENHIIRISYVLCFLILLIQEEKLEPIKNTMDDPRIRLLNRLYARKRKELKERERLKVITSLFLQYDVLPPLILLGFYTQWTVMFRFDKLLESGYSVCDTWDWDSGFNVFLECWDGRGTRGWAFSRWLVIIY